MRARHLVLVILLVACNQLSQRTGPPRERWRTVRHLVDDLAGERGLREGASATIDYVTRYVLAELPLAEVKIASGPVTGAATDAVEITLECPHELAGRRVGLTVSGFRSLPTPIVTERFDDILHALDEAVLRVPASVSCPREGEPPATIPLRGVPAGMTLTPALAATAEPVTRVEGPWLSPPDRAVLHLTLGLADPSPVGTFAPARFRITAENRAGQSISLLDRVLDPARRPDDRGWVDVIVPLRSAVAALGPELRVTFDTEPASTQRPVFPVWGDPAVLVPAGTDVPTRRNVVLVSIDTMRADRLATYGALPTNAPALDRLAREGTFFASAFAAAPWTLPSHTTMLTGVPGCLHHRGANFGPMPAGISPLAEILRQAGYSTGAFTEDVYLSPSNFQRGFGVFDAYTTPTAWSVTGDVQRTVDHARAWLEHEATEPFFLFVHTYQVHAPYDAPPPFGDLLAPHRDGASRSRPPAVQSSEDLARYDEEVRYTDSVLATLLATVDAVARPERTIIVVTGDHGEAFGEHGLFGHTLMLEEVLHVPLIWRAPGLIAAGRRSPVVSSLADIVPTVLDLLGLPESPFAGGGSLAPYMREVEPPLVDAADRVVVSEWMLTRRYPIVVRGYNWHALFEGAGVGNPTLRWVSQTGRESAVAPSSPVLRKALAARDRYEAECRRLGPLADVEVSGPPPPLPTEEEVRGLRALGYLQ